MSDDYKRGREDGLLEAAEIVRTLADAVARRLEKPAARWTRHARTTRHKAFEVASTRIATVARRLGRRRRTKSIAQALEEVGI